MNTPEEIKAAIAAAGYKMVLDFPALLPQTWDSDYEILPVGTLTPNGTQFFTGGSQWERSSWGIGVTSSMCVFRRLKHLKQKAWHEL